MFCSADSCIPDRRPASKRFTGVVYSENIMSGYRVILQDGGAIWEGLICSYCKLVLKNPMQTTESGLRFCKECFDEARG